MNEEKLLALATALGHPIRLRILARLAAGRQFVSELARALGLSRPLLYMHLERLEAAGLVSTNLELGDDGKSRKYVELTPFEIRIDVSTIERALRQPVATSKD